MSDAVRFIGKPNFEPGDDNAVDNQNLIASIQHALALIGEQELHGHTSYVVGHMLKELRPSDLADNEMMAVAIILANAHARKVGRPKPTTVVPIRRENSAAAVDLFPHVLFG